VHGRNREEEGKRPDARIGGHGDLDVIPLVEHLFLDLDLDLSRGVRLATQSDPPAQLPRGEQLRLQGGGTAGGPPGMNAALRALSPTAAQGGQHQPGLLRQLQERALSRDGGAGPAGDERRA